MFKTLLLFVRLPTDIFLLFTQKIKLQIIYKTQNFPTDQVTSDGGTEETEPYIGDTFESLGRHVKITYIAVN
jgi:hypothetical protein